MLLSHLLENCKYSQVFPYKIQKEYTVRTIVHILFRDICSRLHPLCNFTRFLAFNYLQFFVYNFINMDFSPSAVVSQIMLQPTVDQQTPIQNPRLLPNTIMSPVHQCDLWESQLVFPCSSSLGTKYFTTDFFFPTHLSVQMCVSL